jgi:hypothetical protein
VNDAPAPDRRARFFLVAAVAAGLLVPVADREHRWVAAVVAVAYVVLAAGSWLDNRSRAKVPPRYHRQR